MKIIKKIIKFIFNVLTHDGKVKLSVLLLSFSIWAIVSAKEQRINLLPYQFPIEIRNIDDNQIVSLNVDKVMIKIASDRSTFQQITSDKIRVYIDLAGKKKGTYDIDVLASKTLSNIEIVDIEPATILVTVEELMEKQVPVQIILQGKITKGKNVASTTPEAQTATVSGPQTQINLINEVRGLLKLNNQTEDFTENVALSAIDSQGNPLSIIKTTPSSTNVNVKIIDLENFKSVPVKITTSGKVASGYYLSDELKVEPAIVNIIGEPNQLKDINFIATEPINISGLNQTSSQSVSLVVPDGISVDRNISKVNVSISLQKSDISRDIIIPVNIVNLASDKKVTNIDAKTITVSISGELSIVNSVKATDFILNIDLANATNGENDREITSGDLKLPSGIQVLNILPTKIRITVEKL